MATLPRFVLPIQSPPLASDSPFATKTRKPQIQLDTNAKVREGYMLTLPSRRHSRPVYTRTLSTPPDSPTRARSSTLGAQDLSTMHSSGAMTPPPTPTHSKSNSASSDFLTSLSSLRRADSTSSRASRPSLDDSERPGSTKLISFPFQLIDYEFRVDEKGRKRTIGVGAWSDVYLAIPSAPKSFDQPALSVPTGSPISPPLTPVPSRRASDTKNILTNVPPMYAIKVPGSTSAKKVLGAEARVVSYLSRFPDAENHIVPFYGQDSRTSALVLKAMDGTLEDWIQNNLNTLEEASRAEKVAKIFPMIALSLIDSLIWMQERDCVHADVKPSNILVTSPPSDQSTLSQIVFSDFSSTLLTTLSEELEHPPMGAGTWEYLDPSLLSITTPLVPSATTDLWSLAITLLFLVLGVSPFDAFKHNKFQQREMIKSGSPLQCLTYDDQGITNMRRLKTLSKDLGLDVNKWFSKVLVKNKEKRVDISEWRADLSRAMGERMAKI